MSWSIYVNVPPCVTCGNSESVDIGGQTYNVSPMYYDAFGGEGLRGLDGKQCREALPLLVAAVERMQAEPEKYRAMNPKNGWGNYEGALETLVKLREACERYPTGTVVVR